MIDKWNQGYEVVYGRRLDEGESRLKNYLKAFYRILNMLSDINIP